MDALFPIIVEGGKSLIDPIKRNCSYIFNFRRYIQELNIEKEDLMMMQTNIQCLIDGAQRRQEEIFEEVNDWISKVTLITSVIQGLNEEANDSEMCLMGQCPNLAWRYRMARKGVSKLEDVRRLKQRGGLFGKVSFTPSAPVVEPFRTLDNAEELERGKSLLEQILEALCDDNVRSVGIHGMGGIGKTTLMKSLNNFLQGTRLFNKVIMVTVTANPDLKCIQQQIADRLDIKLGDTQSLNTRANKLSKVIVEQQKVLIILDDVWKNLKMYELGIPVTEESMCCKVIITTRIKPICQQMNMEKILMMEVLSETDSWNLFKSTTGDVASNKDLLPLAKQMVEECKGFPLAIVTIGSVLRGERNISMWHGILIKLRSVETSDQEGVMCEAIETIRISYDYLQYEDMRKCLLFCCLFAEDDNIPMLKLFMYGIGEGFLKSNKRNLSDDWKLLKFYVENLKNHNLLLNGKHHNGELEDEYIVNRAARKFIQRINCGYVCQAGFGLPLEDEYIVRLHDVVRETCKSIAQKIEYGFVCKAGLGLSQCPILERPQECKHVSLMKNKITVLSQWPECPELRTLLLQGTYNLEINITETFFEAMPQLLVLDMSSRRLNMLPPSMACLRNLRTLVLDNCKYLKDISVVGSLKLLEMLSMKETCIEELPKELGELTNLKYLDLSYSESLKRIAPCVLSRMVNLQVLNLWNTSIRWDGRGKGGFRNASVSEVASLPSLTDLHLSIDGARYLSMDKQDKQYWSSLQRFKVLVFWREYLNGEFPHINKTYIFAPPNYLQLISLTYPFSNWVNHLVQKTQFIFLRDCTNFKSLSSLVSTCNGNLVRLHIEYCNQIECLMNADQEICLDGFASLKEIVIREMCKLETICKGRMSKIKQVLHGSFPVATTAFHNLEVLEISECNVLRSLFATSVALSNLKKLEKLVIRDCQQMEVILEELEEREDLPQVDSILLPKLTSLSLEKLPMLKSVCNTEVFPCFPILNDIFVTKCLKLERLPLRRENQHHIKNIQSDCTWFEGLLQDMQDIGSKNPRSMFFAVESHGTMINIGEKTQMVHGSFPVATTAFHNLEVLIISECNVLRSLFATSVALSSLKKLEKLVICDCQQMEVILEELEEREDLPLLDGILLPKLTFLSLNNLPKLKSVCNTEVFPCFPILETIVVFNCPKLKRLPLRRENLHHLKEMRGYCTCFEGLEQDMLDLRIEIPRSSWLYPWKDHTRYWLRSRKDSVHITR